MRQPKLQKIEHLRPRDGWRIGLIKDSLEAFFVIKSTPGATAVN